jgi:hypothetical protein
MYKSQMIKPQLTQVRFHRTYKTDNKYLTPALGDQFLQVKKWKGSMSISLVNKFG